MFCDRLTLSRPGEPSSDQFDRDPCRLGDERPAPLRGKGGQALALGQGQAAAVAERQTAFERDGAQHAGVVGQPGIEGTSRIGSGRSRASMSWRVAPCLA